MRRRIFHAYLHDNRAGARSFIYIELSSMPSPHLLQQQVSILIEKEDAEGSMQNSSRRPRNEAMGEILVHVPDDPVVLIQRNYLSRIEYDLHNEF